MRLLIWCLVACLIVIQPSCGNKLENTDGYTWVRVDANKDTTPEVWPKDTGNYELPCDHAEYEKPKPIEISEEDFNRIYRGKKKMHFKGFCDQEGTRVEFSGGKDTLVHYENAHDIYISSFSEKGFDFILDTYTTPSSCRVKGMASFLNYDYAVYNDSAGCSLAFIFYNDTLDLLNLGTCHRKYCGAYAGFGDIYVSQEDVKLPDWLK